MNGVGGRPHMNRRSLLGAMLAACTAPAYVKASSLMHLYVPTPRVAHSIWVPDFAFSGSEDFTMEGWVNGGKFAELRFTKGGVDRYLASVTSLIIDGDCTHLAITRLGMYRNGEFAPQGPTHSEEIEIDRMRMIAAQYGVVLA